MVKSSIKDSGKYAQDLESRAESAQGASETRGREPSFPRGPTARSGSPASCKRDPFPLKQSESSETWRLSPGAGDYDRGILRSVLPSVTPCSPHGPRGPFLVSLALIQAALCPTWWPHPRADGSSWSQPAVPRQAQSGQSLPTSTACADSPQPLPPQDALQASFRRMDTGQARN